MDRTDPTPLGPTHKDPTHKDPTHEEPTHEESTHEEPTRTRPPEEPRLAVRLSERRADRAFQARLRAAIEQNRRALERLAD
ncbi:MAG: hypothetical protein ACYC1D_00865 [Acidimicrobiales bacterium]